MPAFPGSVVPVAWFDGNQPQYSDAAGTNLVTAFRAPVRRANEAAPLTAYWLAIDDAHDAEHDLAGLRSDFIGPSGLTRSATVNVSFQASTVAVSFLCRANPQQSALGFLMCPNGGSGMQYGLGNNLGSLVLYTAGEFTTAVPLVQGVHYSIVARFDVASVKIRVIADGITTDYVETPGYAAVSTGAVAPSLFPVHLGSGFYGSMPQALIVDRAISDWETAALATWLDAQPIPVTFPTDGPLLACLGDSIVANALGWSNFVLGALRPSYPGLEVDNGGIFGAFVRSANGAGKRERLLLASACSQRPRDCHWHQ